MNPSNNVGMELPPPVNEQLLPVNIPEQIEQKQELASPFEAAPLTNITPPTTTLPPPPVMPNSISAQKTTSDDYQTANLPADDGDLIEKEWVNKAKSIVEKTKDDPYKQSEELKVLKSDYLQKRYNKTLKQSN